MESVKPHERKEGFFERLITPEFKPDKKKGAISRAYERLITPEFKPDKEERKDRKDRKAAWQPYEDRPAKKGKESMVREDPPEVVALRKRVKAAREAGENQLAEKLIDKLRALKKKLASGG